MASTDTLEKDIKQLRQDFSTLRDDMQKVAKGVGNEARDRAKKGADAARDRARDVGERGKAATSFVEGQMSAHPWRTALIAAGVGFVASRLLRK